MRMYYRTMLGGSKASLNQEGLALLPVSIRRWYQQKNSSNHTDSVYDSTPQVAVLSLAIRALLMVGQRGVIGLIILGARLGF